MNILHIIHNYNILQSMREMGKSEGETERERERERKREREVADEGQRDRVDKRGIKHLPI